MLGDRRHRRSRSSTGAAAPTRASTLPLVGAFNVANALAAAATARAAGFALDAVARRARRPVVVPGRFERVDAGQPFAVLVDYAHTPDALDRGARGGPRRSPAPAAG